jgi:hypothetical protein
MIKIINPGLYDIKEVLEEIKMHGSLLVSSMEGCDDYIILREDIDDAFDANFYNANKNTIQQAVITQSPSLNH